MAGSLTATTITSPWELIDFDTNTEVSEDADGVLQYKTHSILLVSRSAQDVVAFLSAVNDTDTVLQFSNGGTIILTTEAGQTYVCTSDRLRPNPEKSGLFVQIQTWEYFTDWTNAPAGWIN